MILENVHISKAMSLHQYKVKGIVILASWIDLYNTGNSTDSLLSGQIFCIGYQKLYSFFVAKYFKIFNFKNI